MAFNVIGLVLAVTVAVGVSGARLRRWADGASSSSSAGSFASSGAGGNFGYSGGAFPNSGFVFPMYQPQPFLTPQDLWLQYQQQFQNAYANSVNPGYGGPSDGGLNTRILGPNGGSTSASASIDSNGNGFGTLNGVGFRLGGDYDDGGQNFGPGGMDFMTRGGPIGGASFSSTNPGNPGNGGSFGTFSSSSSSQQTVDGKTQTQHQSSIGVNDNGRITFKTTSNP